MSRDNARICGKKQTLRMSIKTIPYFLFLRQTFEVQTIHRPTAFHLQKQKYFADAQNNVKYQYNININLQRSLQQFVIEQRWTPYSRRAQYRRKTPSNCVRWHPCDGRAQEHLGKPNCRSFFE